MKRTRSPVRPSLNAVFWVLSRSFRLAIRRSIRAIPICASIVAFSCALAQDTQKTEPLGPPEAVAQDAPSTNASKPKVNLPEASLPDAAQSTSLDPIAAKPGPPDAASSKPNSRDLALANASATQQKNYSRFDLAITYAGAMSVKVDSDQWFWLQTGAIEVGAFSWHRLSAVAEFTGGHTASIGASGVPLSLVTIDAGARYKREVAPKLALFDRQLNPRLTLYGETLLGLASGFDSRFPTATSPQTSAHSLAFQLHGGVDYRLTPRFSVRALDLGWMRTRLPNTTDNQQNVLLLGAGVVARF